jgi:hypothetical protein
MKASLRRGLLAAALAATVAAVFLLDKPEEGVVVATKPATSGAKRAPAPAATAQAPVGQEAIRLAAEGDDLFPVHDWRPPPPPAPPVQPMAPPLPFEFKGRMEEGGHSLIFLARQQTMLVVKQGDTLDGLYHVDAVTPWSVEFTYLPLKQKQSLSYSK